MQQDLVGVTGVGGGHRLGRTMVGFVGGCDAGKGYMMSGKCWLKSIYSSPVVHPRALITPSHSWMSMQRKSACLGNGMVQENLESKIYFNKEFNGSYMLYVLIRFAAALKIINLVQII